jgi:penicillin-binding protein 1A
MARSDKRREPRLDGGDLRADPRERPGMSSAKRKRRSASVGDDADDAPTRPEKRHKAVRRGSFIGATIYWGIVVGLWALIGACGLVAYHAAQLPPIDQLAVPKRPPNIAILSADGELLANRGDTGGAAVRLKDLPPYLPKAFVAIEDRRFYSHWGIDPIGIARALTRNIVGQGSMQGGSTITQQLAKNLFLTQERTVSRKIQEAILALWLEHKYSKDQILELYLNRVYFGSGAYGVEAAAQRYFGHGARQVTLQEAAILAGLMKAPSKLAPNRNPEGAIERAEQVVTAMAQEGHITEAMAKLALAHPARTRRDQGAGSIGYAADYVMDVLDDTIGAIDEDIVVTTTLRRRLQEAAERAIVDVLDTKGDKFGVTQGALVALDPNGAIRALVGGRNYAESQFDRAVSAKRQPGSAFKPFVYLAALERGLTPDTIREDGPINIRGWQPENYSRDYFGPVTLTRALALSLNTVAVRVGLEVGPKTVARTAHRLGISSDLQPNASLSLGTSEVTPLELVTAYAPFANGGIGVQPHIIAKVRTAGGKLLYARKGSSNGRVIEPRNVAMMNAMMEETLSTGTARKADLPGWRAAGKTGTSQDFRDAWFIGYTPHLVAGVWLGNDDNSPTKKASGGNLPVEVWSRFMKVAHQGVPVATLPSGSWRSAAAPADLPSAVVAPLLDLFSSEERAEVDAPPQPAPPRPSRSGQTRAAEREPNASVHGLEALLPPADIPEAAPRQTRRRAPQPREEKNFFENLFGG